VYKDKLKNCSLNQFEKNTYTTAQVELKNMYINMGANNGGEKLFKKNTATYISYSWSTMLLLLNSYHKTPFDILFILLGQMIATLTLDVPDKASAKVCVPTGSSS
jgi:hypothetical protein